MSEPVPATSTRRRPAGFSRGAASLVFAWVLSVAIALLTGAAAVIMVLVVLLVALAGGSITGRWALRGARVESVTTAMVADDGDELTWHLRTTARGVLFARLLIDGEQVAEGWVTAGSTVLPGAAPRRGVHDTAEVRLSAAGRPGIFWWRRTFAVQFGPLAVAPRPATSTAPIERAASSLLEPLTTSPLVGRDEVDGVRTWRDGDELTSVHWPSTLRSGEFVVRQRHRSVDERWIVLADPTATDPDLEAARVRTALDNGLAAGATVAVQVGSTEPATTLTDHLEVRRWCAAFLPTAPPPKLSLWRRPLGGRSPEPDQPLGKVPRWMIAGATVTPLIMMLQPLRYGPAPIVVVAGMIALGAAMSTVGPTRYRSLRQLVGLAASLVAGGALIDLSAITSVVNSLRFLLPQLLVTLVVMQGFECTDRRAARISLACATMLTAYAAGIRVDPDLTAWLVASIAGVAIAWQSITLAERRASVTTMAATTRRPRALLALTAAVAAMGMLLAIIPVPEGPAQLTLPSWIDDYRPTPGDGGLVTAAGSPLLGGASGGDRTGTGGGGGYPGFSPTMDTALRGDLGDEVVLRVRAPYPDYWRGQTFTDFDGRVWTVDAEAGTLSDGVDHPIAPTNGDVPRLDDEEFIQTYYAEVDQPNIVFAASRAERVLLEASLWRRPDGALRADVVLPAGSAYTVVSRRKNVTAATLRSEGDISDSRTPSQFVALPEGITDRTLALAQQLQRSTTYDTIIAIQAWLAGNVEYTLDAPVPPEGDDAVDDFLFRSRQGFCEQIATATAMLLRSLGVPARIATGYVPSERDAVAGVWISRARDAHAWVEVRFPTFGWVAFDPTASVPLAGDAELGTIGGALMKSIAEAIGRRLPIVLGGLLLVALVVFSVRLARQWWHRSRRGRWGLLQDRFVAVALARGAPPSAPNAELAAVFDEPTAAAALAAELDASAFAADWVDDDAVFRRAEAALQLAESHR